MLVLVFEVFLLSMMAVLLLDDDDDPNEYRLLTVRKGPDELILSSHRRFISAPGASFWVLMPGGERFRTSSGA